MFGLVHGLIRISEQIANVCHCIFKNSRANTEGYLNRQIPWCFKNHFFHELSQPFSQQDCFFQKSIWQKHGKFFTANAAKDINFSQIGLQNRRHLLKYHITNRMAVRIIDFFEMVKIHH